MNTTDNFVEKLNYYQSANSDSKTIKQNFVIRIHEFESIINTLVNKDWEDSLQHELILGRRGSGKSTLIKRIEIELTENKKLAKKYIPINLAEEQASVYQLHDLWYETLIELQSKLSFSLELREFDTFETTYDYTRYLFFEINKVLKKEKKKAVLLLDNFDRILENFKDDVKMLRDFLINHNNIQIIGGSTKINEHFWQYDKPFYDFFRQHLLNALSFDEINLLLNSWSEIMDKPELKDYAINNRGKIESIRILTDGMPRTLQFFIRILLTDKEIYGFNYIKKIMDNATPLYQEKLNSLTPAQRKIVSEMAFIWEPTTTKELVNKCKMESKLVSSYLKQLGSLGVVDKLDTKNRNKKYRISERFFNMWLIVTQGNPTQKRKAKYLTIFIESWYSEHEIKALAKEHLNKVQEGDMSYDKASVKTKALAQSKHISMLMRDSLIKATILLKDFDIKNIDLPNSAFNSVDKVIEYLFEHKYDLALNEVEKIENEEDGMKYFIKGVIYAIKKENNKARALITEGHQKLVFYRKNSDEVNSLDFILANAIDLFTGLTVYLLDPKKPITISKKSYKIKLNSNKSEIIKIIINFWNNIFETETIDLVIKNKSKHIGFLFKNLLYLEQKNLVLSYFESEKYGEELRDKYRLLYYSTLILTNNIEDIHLKVPKEVIPTVNQIVAEIKEKNEFYNQPSIEE